MGTMKKQIIYHPELEGKEVYPNNFWKNISWFNIQSDIGGWIFGILLLKMFSKDRKKFFSKSKWYLPIIYAKNYHTIKYSPKETKTQ